MSNIEYLCIRCQQLQWALPDWIPTKWLSLFSQNWEGDVTMVLPTESYWTLRKAVVNPTRREVLVAAHAGEMATWQKLPAIQCSSTIERTLDDCLMQLVATLRKNRKDCPKVWKSRIPSWLHMPTSGVYNVEYKARNFPDTCFHCTMLVCNRKFQPEKLL